jgi:hypothetical protein
MMHPALTQYVHTTSHDFRQRLALQLGDAPDEQLDRFSLALDTLQERKAQLVQQLSENLGVSHRVLSVQLKDQSTFELLIASDGTLLANDYFDLRVRQEYLPETVSARLPKQNRTGIKFALPCWGEPTVA